MSEDQEDLPGYDSVDSAEIREQTNNLCMAWNHFIDLASSSPTVEGIHPPPAMLNVYGTLLELNSPLTEFEGKLLDTEENVEAIASASARIVAFGDAMFKFGQFCAAQGLLHANLVPCKCCTVTDEDINQFLGELP